MTNETCFDDDLDNDFIYLPPTEYEIREEAAEEARYKFVRKCTEKFLNNKDKRNAYLKSCIINSVNHYHRLFGAYYDNYYRNNLVYCLFKNLGLSVKILSGRKSILFYENESDSAGTEFHCYGEWLLIDETELVDFDFREDVNDRHPIHCDDFFPIWTKGHKAVGGNIAYSDSKQLPENSFLTRMPKYHDMIPEDYYAIEEGLNFGDIQFDNAKRMDRCDFLSTSFPPDRLCKGNPWLMSMQQ